MTGFSNEFKEHHLVEKAISPILMRYCVQHPIKIDYEKLSKAHPTSAINLFQLAWLQGVSEMNITDISSISWDDHSLCVRVLEIQDHLYKITDDEYGRSDVIINGEQKKREVRYFAPKMAIRLLNSLQFVNHQAALKEKEAEIKRSESVKKSWIIRHYNNELINFYILSIIITKNINHILGYS